MPVAEQGELQPVYNHKSMGLESTTTTTTDPYVAGSDPNCGRAFDAAIDDTSVGFAHGCSQKNPKNPVVAPNIAPVCG